MIRRDLPAHDQSPAAWILISQIEHARLAFELAEAWGSREFAPLVPRRELLWAVEHHDDGWLEWDRSPGVHPETGEPRAFTEMDHQDAIAIWTGSIEIAAAAGPLEGYLVAGHFCTLGRRATSGHDSAWPGADAFLLHYEAKINAWFNEWQAADPAANTGAVAERALRMLQFFDSFSLWFCCGESSDREIVETPGGPDFTIAPRTPYHLSIDPWPFTRQQLSLDATGRIVPAVRYANREDLAAAESHPITLHWELQ